MLTPAFLHFVDSQDRHTGVVSLDEEDPVFAWAISTVGYYDPSAPTGKTDDPNLALRVTVYRLADKKDRGEEGRPRVRRYKVCVSVGWDGSLTASAGEAFRRPPPRQEKRRSFLSRALGRKGRGGPKGFSILLSEVPDLKMDLMEHLAEASGSTAC